MIHWLVYLVEGSLVTFGLYAITREDMIFEKAGKWVEKVFGDFWSKPICACPPCMASVHGTWFYFAVVQDKPVLWPIFVLALAGLNYIVNSKL